MKRRFTGLPIASIAVVVGSLLIGLSLSSVDAQSVLTNGSVTVRSDGAVYLIANNMRRWVATVQISDEEINAYPEAEPIYSGLVPFGTAGTAATTGTTSPATASKTGATTPQTGTTVASKTGATAPTTSSQSTNDEVAPGQVVIDPASGADQKDPNDPTLAAAPSTVDPSGRAQPTGQTTCPDSHKVKGGSDKKYYDVDRPTYLTVQPEACFRTGKDARDAGYTEDKKN